MAFKKRIKAAENLEKICMTSQSEHQRVNFKLHSTSLHTTVFNSQVFTSPSIPTS